MHTVITALIQSIAPYDALEQTQIDTALAWVASGAQLCRLAKPATPPMHLVAYCVLLDPLRRQLLLVDHQKSGLWLPSGGHVEPGEHPQQTARRELAEELQLAADFIIERPIFLTVTETIGSTAGHTDVSLWYVLRGDAAQLPRFDRGEFNGVRWLPLDALPFERTDQHMARFVAKLKLLVHM